MGYNLCLMKKLFPILVLALFLCGCAGDKDQTSQNTASTTSTVLQKENLTVETISLCLPTDLSKIEKLDGFSTTASCPWKRPNKGFSFYPKDNLTPFYAPLSGELLGITCLYNESDKSWVLELEFKHSKQLFWVYRFEIGSDSRADCQAQQNNILVKPGDRAAAASLIADFSRSSDNSRVFFAIRQMGQWKSPAKYFPQGMLAQLSQTLHKKYPKAQLTYN